MRDPSSAKIQQRLQGLCSWKKGKASTVQTRGPDCCCRRDVTGQAARTRPLAEGPWASTTDRSARYFRNDNQLFEGGFLRHHHSCLRTDFPS